VDVNVLMTMLMWVAVVAVGVLVLDLARQPVRRFLVASVSLLARVTCGLRTQLARLRDAVGRWHSAHLLHLEAVRVGDAIDALERDYAQLIGHDLAQLPELRQRTHDTLRELQTAYTRDEAALTGEPAWVHRLEALARIPDGGDQPQSQRLARDMQETVLRVGRLALEEHRQSGRALLASRRRLQGPVEELVSRLGSLQERLRALHGQAQRLDATLKHFDQNRTQRALRLPAYAHATSQWVLSGAGLALAALAVYVYQQLFSEPFQMLFPVLADGTGGTPELAMWVLLGGAALSGWILLETRAMAWPGITPLGRLGSGPRTVLSGLAGVILIAVVVVSMINGYLRDWFLYRTELIEVLMAGGEAPPLVDVSWVAQLLGGLLGLVLPLAIALAPLWLVGLLTASRLLLGAALWLVLALLAGLLQWLAGATCQLRRWLPAAFEVVIFLPQAWRRWRAGAVN